MSLLFFIYDPGSKIWPMAIPAFEAQILEYVPTSWQKRSISWPMEHKQNYKNPLLTYFFIYGPGANIKLFHLLKLGKWSMFQLQSRKCQYPGP